MSFSNDNSLLKIQHIPGLTMLNCPEMQAALEIHLPDLPRTLHFAIINRHSDYITQASLLENEARQAEDEAASVANHAAMLGHSHDTTVMEEIKSYHEIAQLLRQMRVCCVQKIKVLETDTIREISNFFNQDDVERAFLEAVCETDPGIRETMCTVWRHLDFESVMMLRLQLVWALIEKDRQAERVLGSLGMVVNGLAIDQGEEDMMMALDVLMGKMKVEMG